MAGLYPLRGGVHVDQLSGKQVGHVYDVQDRYTASGHAEQAWISIGTFAAAERVAARPEKAGVLADFGF